MILRSFTIKIPSQWLFSKPIPDVMYVSAFLLYNIPYRPFYARIDQNEDIWCAIYSSKDTEQQARVPIVYIYISI